MTVTGLVHTTSPDYLVKTDGNSVMTILDGPIRRFTIHARSLRGIQITVHEYSARTSVGSGRSSGRTLC